MFVIIGLIITIVLLVNLTPVQNFLVSKTASILSDKLKTKVSIGHVRIDFLNHVLVQGLYIEDQAHDTLLYAGEAQMRITDWFIFRKQIPVLSYLGLSDAFIHLYRKSNSDEWNYQFVADAFSGNKKTTTKKENDFQLNLQKVALNNVRFHMDDAWGGDDYDIDAGSFLLKANEVNFKKKLVDLSSIDIANMRVYTASYVGGRPPHNKKIKKEIDTTAFNPNNWLLKAAKLNLDNCSFILEAGKETPVANTFDPEHIDVSAITLNAKKIQIQGDTLTGKIALLKAKERSGFVLKKFTADVTVSPNASICNNLEIETNNSKLKRYYAMHYARFPDFNDYVEKVRMVAHLDDAKVDAADIAYFAPALREQYMPVMRASGNFDGTAAAFNSNKLELTDGASILRGDLAMTGLPDIHNTFIDYSHGEIMTSGFSIFKFLPSLKNSPDVALEKLSYAYFNGSFTGFIDRFVANGVLKTNLGNIVSNVRLNVPVNKKDLVSYSGKVTAEGLNLGLFLRQPLLGSLSLNADLEGKGFKAENAALKFSAHISQLELNGYNYHNIIAEGTLEHKKFKGDLLVDDPNLALAFNGSADFSEKRISFNAKANLLQSDLKALNFTKDSVQVVADFDLDCKGISIDSFSGVAKLYNINLMRNRHRVDIDSVVLHSEEANGERAIFVESNDVTAYIHGNYQLTTLAYSAQKYLYGYLPNYIPPPKKAAPEQKIDFTVKTRKIDSLLYIIAPQVSGFDNAMITGSLNTNTQQLVLNANVPAGIIGTVAFRGINISGTGNYQQLSLNASVSNISVGDSIINVAADVNATLGNDSLSFKVTTTSRYSYGTATINGEAYARGDSLFLKLLPSEFYLNKSRWDIAAGNKIIFSNKYLRIDNLLLNSGSQQITAGTEFQTGKEALQINLQNIDIAQLGAVAGFEDYQPSGKISGKINIDNLIGKIKLNADIRANEVMFGADSIGEVYVVGNFDTETREITLDDKTGIFRKDASLLASGTFGLAKAKDVKVKAKFQFNRAPLNWLTPIVRGYVSNLEGQLNGAIQMNGASSAPNISGSIQLSDASLHVDYLGTNYKIKQANINAGNNQFSFGTINITDQYDNTALLTGNIEHDRLKNFRLRLRLSSDKFEVLNLKDYENKNFYGHLIANVSSMSVTGSLDDIRMSIRAKAAEPSHLYLPVATTANAGSYSYVSFKTADSLQEKKIFRSRNKFSINISAVATPDLAISLILDPATGDQINATGNGTISLDFGSGNDIGIHGNYDIDQGDYTFTFRQLFLKRNFIINSGSSISFGGSLGKTTLAVNGSYRVQARLYDLLTPTELKTIPASEVADAKTSQNIDVILYMTGPLQKPDLNFKLELPEKRAVGTYAYTKLDRINQSDRELFDQVASLLLIGSFIPPEGIAGTTALSGSINNMSEIISSTASSQLTSIVNKLLGDKSLQIELKYKNYNVTSEDPATAYSTANRNEFRFGIKQSLFKERVIVELGSAYDWGRPVSGNSGTTTNFNLAGDFRVQYLITEDGRLRFNLFRNSNYDVLVGNVYRNGAGISWRKTFDNLDEFFHSAKYNEEKQRAIQQGNLNTDSSTIKKATEGTE